MPEGFDYCPVCGQDQRARFLRPKLEELHVGAPVQAPSSAAEPRPVMAAVPQPRDANAPSATAAGRTVPAPVHIPRPPAPAPAPAPAFPTPSAPIDKTVPAPSSPVMPPPGPAPEGPVSFVSAVVDAHTMEPPAGMPSTRANTTEGDRVPPSAGAPRPTASDDDKTIPHQPQRPVSIAPVRAAVAPSTRPDRPGGFSGGPGHGPLPTVNQARTGSGAALDSSPPRSTHQMGSTGRSARGPGPGPRLVLVARDGSEGEVYPLDADKFQMTIGRTHGDLLFPEDPFLSPMHVRIQRSEQGMAIFDSGSTNGVYLRIRGASPVYPGDQFMVGHQLLRLENIDTQVQEQPPAIDGTRVFGTPLQPAWGCVRQIGRGGIVGDKYYLRGAQVVFGREGGDLLFPNDPFVSREHARLRLELHGPSMAVFLEDLESANGSYIRIRGSSELAHMDTFRIGDQILRLRLD